MERHTFILLVDDNFSGTDAIQRVLGDPANHFKLRRVADVPTALARIWGGGVDMVLMTLPSLDTTEEHRLIAFRELRDKAPNVPIVVLGGSGDEGLRENTMREGAADFLIRDASAADILKALRSVAGKTGSSPALPQPTIPAGKRGKILAFMGSKGGVGTTTVALNVAAALTRNRRVILAELHPEMGILPHYFQPHRSIRDLGDLGQAENRTEQVTTHELQACLWPVKNVPGMQVLYGSRSLESSAGLYPALARSILTIAAELADYVVIDLPVSLGETNRAIVECSDCLALVVERDPISVQAAKSILRRVDSWNAAKLSLGAVILNRAALVSPMSFADIDAELHIPTLGVIPPASDLCAAAQQAHAPLVALDTDSLASLALRDLSQTIADLVPSAWPVERAESGPLAAYHAGPKLSRALVR